MTLDMTKGNPFPIILKFMIPLFIGNVFQQLYNMADTIIGQLTGHHGISGFQSRQICTCIRCRKLGRRTDDRRLKFLLYRQTRSLDLQALNHSIYDLSHNVFYSLKSRILPR